MKTNMNKASAPVVSATTQPDSPKLVSLLALATGAVAMPQTGGADIIYTDLSSNPVMVGYAGGLDSFLFNNLPGTALFGFNRQEFSTYTQPYSVFTVNYRTVIAGDQGGIAPAGLRGAANGFAVPLSYGAAWGGGVGSFYNVAVGVANDFGGRMPNSGYDNQYLAWVFSDSTQGGASRYGWVEISLSMFSYAAGGPNVTIWGYAYDDSGLQPTMGQRPIPEPSSAALMVAGAMALGARGLRNWRRNRQPASQL